MFTALRSHQPMFCTDRLHELLHLLYKCALKDIFKCRNKYRMLSSPEWGEWEHFSDRNSEIANKFFSVAQANIYASKQKRNATGIISVTCPHPYPDPSGLRMYLILNILCNFEKYILSCPFILSQEKHTTRKESKSSTLGPSIWAQLHSTSHINGTLRNSQIALLKSETLETSSINQAGFLPRPRNPINIYF